MSGQQLERNIVIAVFLENDEYKEVSLSRNRKQLHRDIGGMLNITDTSP